MTVRLAARQALHTRPSSHAAHFLPSLVVPCTSSTACFSTSQPQCAKRRDGNPNRGVSAVRRTGLNKRQTLSVLKEKLPQPVHPDDLPDELKIETDPNHGLWGFFKDKKLLTTPKEEFAFGRAWSEVELRRKSWDDLHKLWWVCVKERNRIATVTHERQRLRAGYGEYEALERDATVHETQKNIRTVLLQRYYAFERSLQARETPAGQAILAGEVEQPAPQYGAFEAEEAETERGVAAA